MFAQRQGGGFAIVVVCCRAVCTHLLFRGSGEGVAGGNEAGKPGEGDRGASSGLSLAAYTVVCVADDFYLLFFYLFMRLSLPHPSTPH